MAVVVLALGAPGEAVDAVRSVLAQECPVEVVVVNSAGGGMAARLAASGLDVRVVEREERLLVGAARNLGVQSTRARYVAFLAADCRAAPGWIRERLALHRAGHRAVGSAVVNSHPRNPFAWAGHLAIWFKRQPGAPTGLAYGASYERSLFDTYGYFREDLVAKEDTEFRQRLPRHERPVWAPAVHTIHRNPTSLMALLRDQFQRGARMAEARAALGRQPPPASIGEWWAHTRTVLRATRHAGAPRRWPVRLARPLIPLALAAHFLGRRAGAR